MVSSTSHLIFGDNANPSIEHRVGPGGARRIRLYKKSGENMASLVELVFRRRLSPITYRAQPDSIAVALELQLLPDCHQDRKIDANRKQVRYADLPVTGRVRVILRNGVRACAGG